MHYLRSRIVWWVYIASNSWWSYKLWFGFTDHNSRLHINSYAIWDLGCISSDIADLALAGVTSDPEGSLPIFARIHRAHKMGHLPWISQCIYHVIDYKTGWSNSVRLVHGTQNISYLGNKKHDVKKARVGHFVDQLYDCRKVDCVTSGYRSIIWQCTSQGTASAGQSWWTSVRPLAARLRP